MEEMATSLKQKKKETRGGLLDAKTFVLHGRSLLYLSLPSLLSKKREVQRLSSMNRL